MKTYSHLLIAIDFTPFSRHALREAVRISNVTGAALTAVHVMDEFLVHELKNALSLDEAGVLAEWQKQLRKFLDDSDLGTSHAQVEICVGHPYTELVSAAERHHADLLIMGAKGSIQEPGRVGAIAAKCVRKAPLDVLLVREDSRGPFRRIVTCTDFSDSSANAEQCALSLACMDSAALDCVYVYQTPLVMMYDYGGMGASTPYVPDPKDADVWRSALNDEVGKLRATAPQLAIEPVFIEGIGVREGIIAHVLSAKAELVVLSTRGKSGLREMLIGTTAEAIISHAPCSILAVKPNEKSLQA